MTTRIRKEQISSGSATAHQVFAADGSGGVVIETPSVSGSIAVREADGTPTVADVTEIIVSNGTLTDNGDGTVTITTGGGSSSSLTVEEVDGTPSVANVTKIIVTNGTLTDNGDGSVTISIGSGASLTVQEADGTPSVANVTSITVSNGTLTDNGSGSVTINTGGSAGVGGGGHVTILPLSYNAIGQGDWATWNNASSFMPHYLSQITPANSDNITYNAYLEAGTYTLMLIYHKNTTGGIMDIDIDGTEVGSVDQYGSLSWNNRYVVTGISITASGIKPIRLRMDGKNASSSSYKGWIVYFALWRTS